MAANGKDARKSGSRGKPKTGKRAGQEYATQDPRVNELTYKENLDKVSLTAIERGLPYDPISMSQAYGINNTVHEAHRRDGTYDASINVLKTLLPHRARPIPTQTSPEPVSGSE